MNNENDFDDGPEPLTAAEQVSANHSSEPRLLDGENGNSMIRELLLRLFFPLESQEHVINCVKDEQYEEAYKTIEEILVERMSNLIPKILAHITVAAHVDTVRSLHGEVRELLDVHRDFIGRGADKMLEMFMGNRRFLSRYNDDSPELKSQLANYVVSSFFTRKNMRCFVQASTISVFLGIELAKNNHQKKDDFLLYTNSAIVPLTVLRENSPIKVYAFCGPSYDSVCGGWLFPKEDTETNAKLRELFSRNDDPLDTVFLTPKLIDANGNFYFEREDTAHLASCLIQAAQNLVVLTIGNRLTWDGRKHGLHTSCRSDPERQHVNLVVCGKPDSRNGAQGMNTINTFSQLGFKTHWLNQDALWVRSEQ